ncbi:hypothetical protein GMORB2_1266 [Geosmithia morbida]|uniref:C2H2-type domain-containing protein n=1 Tax=Geosmithia morbida TaxID=1094350 RepID=A0A9P5D7R0_9HYPO|nr:uncharacterized protein GMORB2_1266 [Geosmithia morbida]KAF4126020.1 hypothetical protein GMORB2_1266 [Geosmithia morbida]
MYCGKRSSTASKHARSQDMSQSFLDASAMFSSWNDNIAAMAHNARVPYGHGIMPTNGFDIFDQQSPLTTPTFFNFHEAQTPSAPDAAERNSGHSRKSSRRISNGIANQVSKFENMTGEPDTPSDRSVKRESQPDRFSEGYDGSMEETIKPLRRQKARPHSLAIFPSRAPSAEPQSNGNNVTCPSTPKSGTCPMPETFPSDSNLESVAHDETFESFDDARSKIDDFTYPPRQPENQQQHNALITPHQNQQSSAPFESRPMSFRTAAPTMATPHPSQAAPYSTRATSVAQSGDESQPQTPTSSSCHRSPHAHRRTESMASMQSAASISNINFEEAKLETGISHEEISRYIIGPDPADAKWTCTFDDCGKKFGRKENIKSHVQTHLNDRPYQCPSCIKRFVRQHDLKRHAKIHTGIKPYPCECGNRFARHDALTRHKQRGMCVGAFEGIVKRNVKRGRPRKPRPDMDDRMDKASRTRRKNASTSSVSSSQSFSQSDSSAATTPVDSSDMFDDLLHLSTGMMHSQHQNQQLPQLPPQQSHYPHDNNPSSSAPMPSSSSGPFGSDGGPFGSDGGPFGSEGGPFGSDGGLSPSSSHQSFVSPHEIMEGSTPQVSSPESQIRTPPKHELTDGQLAMLVMNPSATTTAGGPGLIPDSLPGLEASDDSIGATSSLDDLLPLDYSGHQSLRSSMTFSDSDHAVIGREFKFDDLIHDGGDMFGTDERDPFFDYTV